MLNLVCASIQTRLSLHFSHPQKVDVEEGLRQKSWPLSTLDSCTCIFMEEIDAHAICIQISCAGSNSVLRCTSNTLLDSN